MAKDHFNSGSKSSPPKAYSYIIEAAYPAGSDIMTQVMATGDLKRDLESWVLEKTSCLPSVIVCPPSAESPRETINIHCTPGFMMELELEFLGRIANVTRVKTRDEIIEEQNPWLKDFKGPKL